jgi:hypothetical protein
MVIATAKIRGDARYLKPILKVAPDGLGSVHDG